MVDIFLSFWSIFYIIWSYCPRLRYLNTDGFFISSGLIAHLRVLTDIDRIERDRTG